MDLTAKENSGHHAHINRQDKDHNHLQADSLNAQPLDISRLNQKVDDIYHALSSCISSHCVSKEDLLLQMDLKANRDDLNMILVNKVDKQHVVSALQRKATKNEVASLE